MSEEFMKVITFQKKFFCPHCEYKCRDKYQLKVHIRSHTREKPFKCPLCNFTTSKMEDCRRHQLKCKGPKYKCPNCEETFKSKIAINKHYMWDKTCGTLAQKDVSDLDSVVRIDLSQDVSVLGLNCKELLSDEVFEKKARRQKCGVCFSCHADQNCGDCSACKSECDEKVKRKCLRRICHQAVDVFKVKHNDSDINNKPALIIQDPQVEGQFDVHEQFQEKVKDSPLEVLADDLSICNEEILYSIPIEMGDSIPVGTSLELEMETHPSNDNNVILLNENVLQISDHYSF